VCSFESNGFFLRPSLLLIVVKFINTLLTYDRKSITTMTIQNSYTDTTANAVSIPTATAVDSKDIFIEDNTDIKDNTDIDRCDSR